MRLVRVGPVGQERPAVWTGPDRAVDVSSFVTDVDGAFLASGGPERLAEWLARRSDLPEIDLSQVRIGAPISRPGKVVCVGLNYRAHAAEGGMAVPAEPVLFLKAAYTVVGPYDDVLIPPGSSKTDYEVELAVIIGRPARYLVGPAAAFGHIAGYAVTNDVSEREYQLERGGQWDKGKSCETFNPLGPWLVTADEIRNPQALGLELSVNGSVRQKSTTSDMIFDVAHLVWYISQFMVLEAGDVINTGTPHGVGLGMKPARYLRDGDVVELSIEGLGNQRQVFRQARAGR